MIDLDAFWGPGYGPREAVAAPPPSEFRVRRWEEERSVRLPDVLARLMAMQDGGCVRGASLVVFPLAEFRSLAELGWDASDVFGDGEPWELARLYRFGAEDVSQAGLVIDLSASGAGRILWESHESHGELRCIEGASTFEDLVAFLRGQAAG